MNTGAFHGLAETKTAFETRAGEHCLHYVGNVNFKGCNCLWCDFSYESLARALNVDLGIVMIAEDIFDVLNDHFLGLDIPKDGFTLEFIRSIRVGSDLSKVTVQWASWVLNDAKWGLRNITTESSVHKMADLFAREVAGDNPTQAEFDEVFPGKWKPWDSSVALHTLEMASAMAAFAASNVRDAERQLSRWAKGTYKLAPKLVLKSVPFEAAWAWKFHAELQDQFVLAARDEFLRLIAEAR